MSHKITEEIINSAARTLWAYAYAGICDEDPTVEPRAGAGEDWISVAPETPESVLKFARKLIERIERDNQGQSIYRLWDKTLDKAFEPEAPWYTKRDPDPYRFGHCLAMEALGSGIAWSDDYPDHGLVIPDIEFVAYKGDDGNIHTDECGSLK